VIVIIFGVSGAGKTTIGKLLAHKLCLRFIEADDFQPTANVEKMRSGRPLTDEDRWPWLEHLHEEIKRSMDLGESAVLACSALKRAYRDRLRVNESVKFVFLRGDYSLVENQLRNRPHYFMDPNLLQSQFDDLEEPESHEHVLTVQLEGTPEEIVGEIKAKLRLAVKLG